MARIKQPVQIVCDKGVTVADEQVVVSVLELLHAFLQRAVPRGISFRFNKLIGLQIPKDSQCSVVSVSMIRAYNTSILHKYVMAASHRGEHKLQITNLIAVYLNVARNSSERKVVN